MSKIDYFLREMGHSEAHRGTELLRSAVEIYTPGMSMTKELYPALAKAAGTNPARVERNMRHSIARAMERAPRETKHRFFGNSINPETGAPTVGEYVATMARLIHDEESAG